jgi:hypothetical protein
MRVLSVGPEERCRRVDASKTAPLIYVIGVDRDLTRALRADHPDCVVRPRCILRRGQARRRGARPRLVLVGSSWVCLEMEMDVVWASWGSDVVVISVDGGLPYARAWQHARLTQVLEIGPKFLMPFLSTEAE